MIKIVFKLYISGDSIRQDRMLEQLRRNLDHLLPEQYNLTVLELPENFSEALVDQVRITPTLLRVSPQSTQRMFGDIGDREMLAHLLEQSA